MYFCVFRCRDGGRDPLTISLKFKNLIFYSMLINMFKFTMTLYFFAKKRLLPCVKKTSFLLIIIHVIRFLIIRWGQKGHPGTGEEMSLQYPK